MTEQEWLAATDPTPMLEFLRGPAVQDMRELHGRRIPFEVYPERRASDRKLRLLAVACCRRYWHLLDVEHCRKLAEVGDRMSGPFSPSGQPLNSCQRGVELAELAADGPVDPEALEAAREAADLFHHPASDYSACYVEGWGPFDTELMASGNAAYAVHHACVSDIDFSSVGGVIWKMAHAAGYLNSKGYGAMPQGGDAGERAAQAELVRDIFGNPFRPVAVEQSWLTSTVAALAEGMYQDRAFDRLLILADALQDAGCDNEDVLNHCRQTCEHVRGCWVVDLLTGRK
jgi:hypothetical protein